MNSLYVCACVCVEEHQMRANKLNKFTISFCLWTWQSLLPSLMYFFFDTFSYFYFIPEMAATPSFHLNICQKDSSLVLSVVRCGGLLQDCKQIQQFSTASSLHLGVTHTHTHTARIFVSLSVRTSIGILYCSAPPLLIP